MSKPPGGGLTAAALPCGRICTLHHYPYGIVGAHQAKVCLEFSCSGINIVNVLSRRESSLTCIALFLCLLFW
jgi:hypothetical protein